MIPLDVNDQDGQRCTPAAVVHGEGVLAQALQAELLGRGLRGEASQACPAVRVNLVEDGGVLRLEILDPDGRAAYRTAPTIGVAAAFVESWSRSDLLAPLLVEKGEAKAPEVAIVAAPAPTTDEPLPFALRAAFEPAMALGGGGGLLGGRLGGCWRASDACFGLDLSFRQSLPPEEESAPRLLFRTIDAHLTAEVVAARFGDVALRPSIGLGVGRLEQIGLAEDQQRPAALVTPRVRLGADLDWALADSLAISLGAGAELLVAIAEDDGEGERDRRGPAVSRQPSTLVGLQIGARWGAP